MTTPLERLPNTYRAFFSSFPTLTAAQKQLIQPILSGKDVILQASTGAGKTEAVLAPATERLIIHADHFTIIYIVPTRALAADMNRRIKPIYKKLGLKAGTRTGDGKHLRNAKPHLLIMTPESLDVMLGSANHDNKYFLKHTRIMIIDEVHVFLHDNRGQQLAYLHHRLLLQSGKSLQTIALSATIDNAEDITRFFELNNAPFYYKQETSKKLHPCWVHITDEERELPLFFDSLYRHDGCKKLLVFANSRKQCEQLYDILNQEESLSQKVFLHYSNLAARERKVIEASFHNEKSAVCIATSTLELGIDIGDIDGVVLMGPPPSTMAFLQRIGRGNRRQQQVKFWGICYGHAAGRQLLRFLAFFELAKGQQLERCHALASHSVLFQQILSCLYAKKILSKDSLQLLFPERAEDISAIFEQMIAKHWLKATKQVGIYEGGWRYIGSLKKQQIWSNFPPADEEYDVILDSDKIAVLPLSIVKQLEIGDLIQLTGKALKVLQIEEKQAALEVWVEEAKDAANKELLWCGLGPLIPFEVAQKMGEILTQDFIPPGLLKRTQRLLQQEREKIAQSFKQPNGIRVYQLGIGAYRYETFLGSLGNYILSYLLKTQFSATLEGLTVHFDELGLECNEWIPFDLLKIPHTAEQLQKWLFARGSLLQSCFAWNSWLYCLPKKQQHQEIASRLYDTRLLKYFQKYQAKSTWLPLPARAVNTQEIIVKQIQPAGEPWSLEKEKQAWGRLSFPNFPEAKPGGANLTATQIQAYVRQKLCPRWARLQRLGYQIQSHPRFNASEQDIQVGRSQGIAFKQRVIEALTISTRVSCATAGFTWQQAIRTVILEQKPLFLAQAKLKIKLRPAAKGEQETANEQNFASGNPDLIYIKPQGSHICLEVWDIKFSQSISYAQKWRVAFYSYLLGYLLDNETFLLPVCVSVLGGIVYPSTVQGELFEKLPFALAPYKTWMPRLLEQWQADSALNSAIGNYAMEFSCTSCHYFSYCYQETIFKDSPLPNSQSIISHNIESNDFPKNTKQWYFIHYEVHYDNETVRWQCWENGVTVRDHCLQSADFSSIADFRIEAAGQLQKEWQQSVKREMNPHLLVYEASDWYLLQRAFQATALQSLWAMHVCWTSIQTVLQTHFLWPIAGRITTLQVGACLGLVHDQLQSPLSLYHKEPFLATSFDLYRQIWSWCLANIKSRRTVSFRANEASSIPLLQAYLAMHHQETECRSAEIIEFQKNPLLSRVEQYRAIGPMRFIGVTGKKCYQFSIDKQLVVSKFRAGDFLKLSSVASCQIQEGFSVILESYIPDQGTLTVRPLAKKIGFSKNQLYSLDEDITDWNAPKITKVLNLLQKPNFSREVMQILLGHAKAPATDASNWLKQWYQLKAPQARLNNLQQQALALPFREKIGLIEGPPGTGKTHLLVWTIIALVAQAKFCQRSLKILVTAQTHHAIDQILIKLGKTLPLENDFDVSLLKYGRFDDAQFTKAGIEQIKNYEILAQHPCLVLGATGFGVYQLLEGKQFPQLFDWVIFDEASQVLTPYALLSLVFGRGQALFYGDTQQLSPILKGNYENTSFVPHSILEELISRYGTQNRLRLNETYRMNPDICEFASKQWYNNELQSKVAEDKQKLMLANYPLFNDRLDNYLDPAQSMVTVQLNHIGAKHSAPEEAQWVAEAVKRLLNDYSIAAEQIGIISPHRLQNNTILLALKEALPFSLKLPKIDTVERMQGLEFDIVIFSATVSAKEAIHSPFLKEYRRFNVALTRSRKKFIFVASTLFFQAFPTTEGELIAQMPFEIYTHRF